MIIRALIFCASCANEKISNFSSQIPANSSNINANSLNTNSSNANAVSSANDSTKRRLDVPYIQTPEEVVDAMLKIAQVKKNDILYDLGSGDGRIPIAAAQRFSSRGVGIDIDPERVKEAIENAKKAKVADKVKFIEGDIFQTDFSEATVITMYLLPEINSRLQPKLLELKPGTRIVSHNYGIGDWQPEKVEIIDAPDGEKHFVYFWRVPER